MIGLYFWWPPRRRRAAPNAFLAEIGHEHVAPKWLYPFAECLLRRSSEISTCCARARLLHEPAVAYHQRLPGQRVAFEARKEHRRFGHVRNRGEFPVDRVLQHHVLDDFGL